MLELLDFGRGARNFCLHCPDQLWGSPSLHSRGNLG